MADFTIKRGDSSPSIERTLADEAENPVNLTGATVMFFMGSRWGGDLKVSAEADIVDPEAGTVRYDWESGDTDTHGKFYGEFQVTYVGGAIETFPNTGHLNIEIVRDLGPEA